MTPVQFYITVGVLPTTTIIIVLIGVLLNNSNLNHRIEDVNRRIDDMNGHIDDMHRHIDDTKELLRAEIAKLESILLTKFAELDNRLSRLEDRSR